MPNEDSVIKEVSVAVAAHRYSVCKGCPHMRKWRKTCKVCGCPLLTKVRFTIESCPLGKW